MGNNGWVRLGTSGGGERRRSGCLLRYLVLGGTGRSLGAGLLWLAVRVGWVALLGLGWAWACVGPR